MKRIIILPALLVFAVLMLPADVIEKKYQFSNPKITQNGNYHQISFDGTLMTGLTGEPTLPYFAVSLILPPGHVAQNIEFIPGKEVQIPGIFQIYPMQNPQPVSKGGSGT